MGIVCQQTILMKYQALFVTKSRKKCCGLPADYGMPYIPYLLEKSNKKKKWKVE